MMIGSGDDCGDQPAASGMKNTYTIHENERGLSDDYRSGEDDYFPSACVFEGQDGIDGSSPTYDIHLYGQKRSYNNVACSKNSKPWMAKEPPGPGAGKKGPPAGYITEYMDQYRCHCLSSKAYARRIVPYTKPTPIDFRPSWNSSTRVPCRPYQETLGSSEAKIRLLDGLLMDELDPQDAIILLRAQQEVKEQFRGVVDPCGCECTGTEHRYHSVPGIKKTRQVRSTGRGSETRSLPPGNRSHTPGKPAENWNLSPPPPRNVTPPPQSNRPAERSKSDNTGAGRNYAT